MERRTFIGGSCASLAAATMFDPSSTLAESKSAVRTPFKRAHLVGLDGQPLKASSLEEGKNFVFYYPFVSSPAFLINTGMEIAPKGGWSGGTGHKKTIVAFAAICGHLLSHPKKKLSPISYRHKKEGNYAKKDRVITCCTHGSVYDVDQGGERISGPATVGLAAITMDHDVEQDTLTATGVYGAPWIHLKFLKRVKRELRKEFGRSDYKKEAEGPAQIRKLEDVSKLISNC